MKIEAPTTITIAGLVATIAAVVAAVEPVLPADTPQWVRTALAIAAVVTAALLRSPIVGRDGHDGVDRDDADRGATRGRRHGRPRTIVLPPRDGGA